MTLYVSVLFTISAQAEPVDEADPQADARQAYDHLLKEYVAGKTGIDRLELLYNWSLRVASVDLDVSIHGQKIDLETPMESLRQHVSRMKQLEQRVLVLARAGSVSSAELAAARYLHWQAARMESQIKEQMKRELATSAISELPAKLEPLEKPSLVITVVAKGNLLIDNKRVSRSQLKKWLQKNAVNGIPNEVLIKASADCQHQDIVEILDICTIWGAREYK